MALMPSSHLLLFISTLLLLNFINSQQYPPLTLTIVNNCPYTIWPAIQPDGGHAVLANGGFALPTVSHCSFPAPTTPWSGRIWARTGCTATAGSTAPLSCATGDCAGRLECLGAGGVPPATLAQLSLHNGGDGQDLTAYDLSLVDGFNVGMTITPHGGKGRCSVVGCRENLLETCPEALRLTSPAAGGAVVGCKSGCEAFRTDELCCRNAFNSAANCKASNYSEFFKEACPMALTFAHDRSSVLNECSAPKEMKIIFCH